MVHKRFEFHLRSTKTSGHKYNMFVVNTTAYKISDTFTLVRRAIETGMKMRLHT